MCLCAHIDFGKQKEEEKWLQQGTKVSVRGFFLFTRDPFSCMFCWTFEQTHAYQQTPGTRSPAEHPGQRERREQRHQTSKSGKLVYSDPLLLLYKKTRAHHLLFSRNLLFLVSFNEQLI
jgi:hypothetical protein